MPKRKPDLNQPTLDAFLKKGKRTPASDVSTKQTDEKKEISKRRELKKPHAIVDFLSLKHKITSAMKTEMLRDDGCFDRIKKTSHELVPNSGTTVDIDRTGLLAVGGGNGIRIAEINPFTSSVELTRVRHTISYVMWDMLSDSRLMTSFNTHPGVWIFDLETCEETNPTATSALTGPTKGVVQTSQYHSVVVGASKDGKSYLWDCRTGNSHFGSISHTGAFDDNKKTPQFGISHTSKTDPSKVSFPVTAVHLFDNTLITGTANGVVLEFDTRFLKSGPVNSASVCGKTFDEKEHEIRVPVPDIRKNSIQHLQPSPFSSTTVVALSGSCLVEVDLASKHIVRCYAPPEHFFSEVAESGADGERTNSGGVFSAPLPSAVASSERSPAKSFAWSAVMSSFILPCEIGCRVVPWEGGTNWVKWTPNAAESATDELTFSSESSKPISIYRIDLPKAGIAAATSPVDWSFVSSTGSELHTLSWG